MSEHPVLTRTRRFYEWEIRGRGWLTYPYCVELEPPFRPFEPPWTATGGDDGRRESFFSHLFSPAQSLPSPEEVEEEEPLPEPAPDLDFEERRIILPEDGLPKGFTDAFLPLLELAPLLAVEWVAAGGRIEYRLAAEAPFLDHLEHALAVSFPEVRVKEARPLTALYQKAGDETLVMSAALMGEFMVPIAANEWAEAGILGALAHAEEGELIALQLLSEVTAAPWRHSILRAVQTPSGDSYLADIGNLPALAQAKCAAPLRAVVLRVLVAARSVDRAVALALASTRSLESLGAPDGNALFTFPEEDRERAVTDFLERSSHRSGMLVSHAELRPLVAVPRGAAHIPGMVASSIRTTAPPERVLGRGVLLGDALHDEERIPVYLDTPERMRHLHLIGATGTGKSTLLYTLLREDIEGGRGVALIDPHGELAERVVAAVPEERLRDLLLIDPAHEESAPGWNQLRADSEVEAEALSADLVDAIRRLATSWGDQMTSVLGNAILAIIHSGGGTLLDLHTFLLDADERRRRIALLEDEYLETFWQRHFPALSKGRSLAPILTRLDSFLRVRMVRKLVAPQGREIDWKEAVSGRKIVIASLAHGRIGRENASLLGSLLVSALYRAALTAGEHDPFFLYIDEVHEVATPSLAGVLTGARKFGLSLTVAHQDLSQLSSAAPGVKEALLGNAGTRIAFRLGEGDARAMAPGFAHFEADDLLGLQVGEALARVGGAGDDFRLRARLPVEMDRERRKERVERVHEQMATLYPAPERKSRTQPVTPPLEEVREEPAVAPEPVAPVPTPGRGGAEHKYLQALVKRLGEERGFRAVLEEGAGDGQVDVALYRDDRKIAVEVSVTTTPEHEVGNVRKCLAVGFDEVLVVGPSKARRRALEKRFEDDLSEEEREQVSVFSPEELSAYLLSLPAEAEESVRGWKVRRSFGEGKGDSGEARKAMAKIIGKSLRRLNEDN